MAPQFDRIWDVYPHRNLATNLHRIAECIEETQLSKESRRTITDQVNQLAREVSKAITIPLPTRNQFFSALKLFGSDLNISHLRDLDPLAREYPICLFKGGDPGFVVVLLVRLHAFDWIPSQEDGKRTIDVSMIEQFNRYSVTGLGTSNLASTCKERVTTTLLADSLPLGEIYVLPDRLWDEILARDADGISLSDEYRTNFYAILGLDARWGPKDIWAVYNYHYDYFFDGYFYNPKPRSWSEKDLLLTLLRDESELSSHMFDTGMMDKGDGSRLKFDFIPLLPIHGEVISFERIRQHAIEGGKMVRPALKPHPVVQPDAPKTPVDYEEDIGWGSVLSIPEPEETLAGISHPMQNKTLSLGESWLASRMGEEDGEDEEDEENDEDDEDDEEEDEENDKDEMGSLCSESDLNSAPVYTAEEESLASGDSHHGSEYGWWL